MKIVGFVPARIGSKRVAEKNLQKILGVPLFLWAANNLNRVLPKDHIYIDSNSKDILNLAEKFGFQTIERPEDLATNATNGNEFMLWEVSNVDADIYIQHLPPMPFLSKNTLEKAIKKITDTGHDSAFTALKEKLYLWSKSGPKYDIQNIPNSFDLETTIIEGMGCYVTTKESILNNKTRVGKNPAIIEMDKFESIDIDYPEDLELARSIARGLGFDSPYTSGINSMLKAKNIKMVVFDIDGVMTDGGMYYTETGDEMKKFNTKDGIAIKNLKEKGYKVGFLSSGFNRKIIENRAKLFNADYVYVGTNEKLEILTEWCKECNITTDEVAYVGDDVNDIKLIDKVGFFACPSDAIGDIKNKSTVVLQSMGGKGCIREFVDSYIEL